MELYDLFNCSGFSPSIRIHNTSSILESLKFEINLRQEEKDAYLETLKQDDSNVTVNEQSTPSELECSTYESTRSESSTDDISADETEDEEMNNDAWHKFSLDSGYWDIDDLANKRPVSYDEFILTKEEASGILSQRIVSSALSHVAQLPDQSKCVFTKLHLPSKGIVDINILKKYKDLMCIDLSNNKIEEMNIFSNMIHLIYLNLSNNQISFLDIEEAKPIYLTFLDVSFNKLEEIPDLDCLWSLTHLDLSNNAINYISGLWSLRHLKILNLSHNKITVFNVTLFTMNIKYLNLSHNAISEWSGDVDDLIMSQTLVQLNISNNQLKTIEQVRRAYWLMELDVSCNCIDDIQELNHLGQLKRLDSLCIDGNILWELTDIRGLIIHFVPSLSIINGLSITMTDRINAADLYSNTLVQNAFQIYSSILVKRHSVEPLTFGMDPSLRFREKSCDHIVILVGPPGSCKWEIISKLSAKYPSYIRMGKLVTTRRTAESHLKPVTIECFNSLIDSGNVVTYDFRLGAGYALCWDELENRIDGQVTLFGMELSAALCLTWQGIRATLIYTFTDDNSLHLERLKEICADSSSLEPTEKHHSDNFIAEEARHLCYEEKEETSLSSLDESGGSGSVDSISADNIIGFFESESDETLEQTATVFSSPCDIRTFRTSLIDDRPKTDQETERKTDKEQETVEETWSQYEDVDLSIDVYEASAKISGISICLTEEEVEEEEKVDKEYIKNHVFIDSVFRSKDEYLDIHEKTPGLFYTSLKTDNVNECLKKLTLIIQQLYKEDNKIANEEYWYKPKEDPLYVTVVQRNVDEIMNTLSQGHSITTFRPITPKKEPLLNKTNFYFSK